MSSVPSVASRWAAVAYSAPSGEMSRPPASYGVRAKRMIVIANSNAIRTTCAAFVCVTGDVVCMKSRRNMGGTPMLLGSSIADHTAVFHGDESAGALGEGQVVRDHHDRLPRRKLLEDLADDLAVALVEVSRRL